MGFQPRTALELSVKTAVIEHLRWGVSNIPSTTREIAESIGRSESAVRRVLSRMVAAQHALRVAGNRYMLNNEPNTWIES